MSHVLRAAAHVHSAWSDDAHWPLAKIVAAFGERGYDAVLLSDHSRGLTADAWDDLRSDCAKESTAEVLLIPGVEYNDPANLVHVPVWGDLPFYGNTPAIGELLEQVSAAGGSAVLAHPGRRDAWRSYDPAWTSRLTGVEVWNRKYDGIAPNRRSLAFARRHGLRPFVATDFHTSRQFFPLAMHLELDDTVHNGVTVKAAYAALAAGRVQPMYRDDSIDRVTSGAAMHSLRALELTRRAVRPAVRVARRLRG